MPENVNKSISLVLFAIDKSYWELGDALIRLLGEDPLPKHIREVSKLCGITPNKIRMYLDAAVFYNEDERWKYSRRVDGISLFLSFRHYVVAMKHTDSLEQAMRALALASLKKLTPAQLKKEIMEARGEEPEKFKSIRLPEKVDDKRIEACQEAGRVARKVTDEIGRMELVFATALLSFQDMEDGELD